MISCGRAAVRMPEVMIWEGASYFRIVASSLGMLTPPYGWSHYGQHDRREPGRRQTNPEDPSRSLP